jgi:hypothetical protein
MFVGRNQRLRVVSAKCCGRDDRLEIEALKAG